MSSQITLYFINNRVILIFTNTCNFNFKATHVQSVSIARSQGLLESFCVSFPCNFILAWLHSSCSRAHRWELPQKYYSKPFDRAIDALCNLIQRNQFRKAKLTFLATVPASASVSPSFRHSDLPRRRKPRVFSRQHVSRPLRDRKVQRLVALLGPRRPLRKVAAGGGAAGHAP